MIIWMVKQIKKLIKILNSGQTPAQIAGGLLIGAFFGLVPFNWLYSVFILMLLYFINVNRTMGLFGILLFSLIAYLTDPISHFIGYYLLVQVSFLKPLWTFLYNLPIVPYIKFNNTIMLGSIVLSLILALPIYFGMKKFVVVYRNSLQAKMEKLKIIKAFKATKLFSFGQRFFSQ